MNVHKIHVRVIPKEMVVKRGHFDAVVQEGGHDRIYFFLEQHQVAHHNVAAVCPFVKATHPPKPKGVGVDTPWIVIFRSLRGMLTLSTPALKSPLRSKDFSTS